MFARRSLTALATTTTTTSSSAACPRPWNASRAQGWSGHVAHKFLHETSVKQHDGVDDIIRVKAEQQRWLDHEQFSGYSDTYLKTHMRYTPQYEYFGGTSATTRPNKVLALITEICFSIYGDAADTLELLESDPLRADFAEKLEHAKGARRRLEDKIDAIYAEAHPTVKTMYDAMLVKRWQVLEDWIELCVRKRADILARMSPEWIEEQARRKGIAEAHMARLKHLGAAMEANPTGFLEGQGFSEEEMVMIKRRKRFFQRQTSFGAAVTAGDYRPH